MRRGARKYKSNTAHNLCKGSEGSDAQSPSTEELEEIQYTSGAVITPRTSSTKVIIRHSCITRKGNRQGIEEEEEDVQGA